MPNSICTLIILGTLFRFHLLPIIYNGFDELSVIMLHDSYTTDHICLRLIRVCIVLLIPTDLCAHILLQLMLIHVWCHCPSRGCPSVLCRYTRILPSCALLVHRNTCLWLPNGHPYTCSVGSVYEYWLTDLSCLRLLNVYPYMCSVDSIYGFLFTLICVRLILFLAPLICHAYGS